MSLLCDDDAMTLRCEAVEVVDARDPADQQGQISSTNVIDELSN